MKTLEKVKELILHGENIHVEYKRSKDSLSRDLFETICAFLNREGGYLLLGVDDDGCVEGISDRSIDNQIKTLVRNTNILF